MPIMTGVDATRAIRLQEQQLGRKNPCVIIGITGNALSMDMEEFMVAGCNHVFVRMKLLKKYFAFAYF